MKTVQKEAKDLEEKGKEVLKYIEQHFHAMDKETMVKYIPIALLALYGISKSNVLRSLLVSIAIGLIAKYVEDKLVAGEDGATA